MSRLTLPAFNSHVCVIGDVMLDSYWSGPSSRVSPEAPVPVVNINKEEFRAGGAANVALNIASLHAPCSLISVVGNDETAQTLEQHMQNHHIDTQFIHEDNFTTTKKIRILSRHQQLLRLDFESSDIKIDHHKLRDKLQAVLPHTKALICSDYGKGVLFEIEEIISLARSYNVPILVDPKGTNFNRYKYATLLTPNMAEFEAVAGKVKDESDLVAKALKMIDDYALSALLITRSEDGMSLIRPNMPPFHLPTRAREVYDVTGAGDTVIASLATALAQGLDLVEASEIANRAAGIVVGKLGTSTVSPQELKEELLSSNTNSVGIVDEDTLVQRVAELKSSNKRIVMTNGCFDILHRGHVDYLKKARAMGDILIVAVNSDESVRRLKGPSRPIITLDNRMFLLEALSCVDYVVAFEEDDPQRLIARILPDILVKGGDYQISEIKGHKEVLQNGGKVVTIDLVPAQSTTNIVKKIQG